MDTMLADKYNSQLTPFWHRSHFTDLMTGFYCACILCFRISYCQQVTFLTNSCLRLDTYSVTAGRCGGNKSPCTLWAAAPGSWWCCPRTGKTWPREHGLCKHRLSSYILSHILYTCFHKDLCCHKVLDPVPSRRHWPPPRSREPACCGTRGQGWRGCH